MNVFRLCQQAARFCLSGRYPRALSPAPPAGLMPSCCCACERRATVRRRAVWSAQSRASAARACGVLTCSSDLNRL